MNEIAYRYDGSELDILPLHAYPDGTPIMTRPADLPEAVMVRGDLQALITALFWIDAVSQRYGSAPHLVVPCVPGQRQDRLNASGDYLFTAKSVAQAINARQCPSVTVLDPHSDVTPALIDRCRVATAANDLVPMNRRWDGVIAPDGGATKRAHLAGQLLGVPVFHAWKSRDVTTGDLTGFGVQSLPKGRYLVVDDLCDGGGTFVGLAAAIEREGCEADLFVTHGLFTKGTEPLRAAFEEVYTTDSVIGAKPGITEFEVCNSLLLGVR